MTQNIIQIGNSVGIILPQDIRKESGIAIGDTIEVVPEKGKITLKKVNEKKKAPRKPTAKFAQMVDEFMTEHEDVLQQLAKQ